MKGGERWGQGARASHRQGRPDAAISTMISTRPHQARSRAYRPPFTPERYSCNPYTVPTSQAHPSHHKNATPVTRGQHTDHPHEEYQHHPSHKALLVAPAPGVGEAYAPHRLAARHTRTTRKGREEASSHPTFFSPTAYAYGLCGRALRHTCTRRLASMKHELFTGNSKMRLF